MKRFSRYHFRAKLNARPFMYKTQDYIKLIQHSTELFPAKTRLLPSSLDSMNAFVLKTISQNNNCVGGIDTRSTKIYHYFPKLLFEDSVKAKYIYTPFEFRQTLPLIWDCSVGNMIVMINWQLTNEKQLN